MIGTGNSSKKRGRTYFSLMGDTHVLAFLAATSITDPTITGALNTLVGTVKDDGLGTWDEIFAMYPMVGANATAHSFNLINTATHQITWVGGLTHSSTGVLSNGTTGYGRTGVIPSTHEIAGDAAYGFYSRTDFSSSTSMDIGCYVGATDDGSLLRTGAGGNLRADLQSSGPFDTQEVNVANANTQGFYIISRTSATLLTAYKNGSSIGTNTNSTSTRVGIEYYLLGLNQDGSLGGDSASPRECAFAFFSNGLTSAQASSLSTAVATFQTTLGRNV